MKHIVVFASGSGTNFQALIDAIESGKINARITGLVTNKSGIQALERAHKHDIDTFTAKPSSFRTQKDYIQSLLTKLEEWETDLIVLAGYMIKVPVEIIEEYSGRIINIHPSLLPKYGGKGFYGIKVHEAVLENNENETGCTVHLVTEEYDKGPVLGQIKVPVKSSDNPESLAKRVLEKEHELLTKVVDEMINELNPKTYN
ncbi:phosphoribosylglycinamide formyltransferase [Balneolaceae bacterium YR4-1]|uniref:Phosphoribosylglycinamide formyltransferase n=1 Tax=Halalkalibaculum roseum TaxID=2709311 RepID=A0A6M1T395_9BACT|nr:phosphoribosylglycinamide formyltransferase [Halalkalibaculum roseum]NGP77207.1 phosphoribosylglycinamide formyltransferase [Halalkalibaculum roseum]